jgi:dTDP-4-amino-4,6-dideoxygalactose transaminase
MSFRYITFGAPSFGAAERAELIDSIDTGWIGTGPKVQQFEAAFREYLGVPHAVAVNSCTAALHLSMLVAGIKPGDEVITTSMTFAATANAIIHAGGTPVLVDCDRRSQLIEAESIERAITPRTRAVIPVHMAGRICDMHSIMELARERGLIVIEDAAHAIEGAIDGQKVGGIADFTCFSFYVTKNITTGEGGMITTASAEHERALRMYALHGLSSDAWKRYSDDGVHHYEVCVPGYKYNFTDMHAALGLHQLAQIEPWLVRREEIWRRYDEAFAALPVDLPPPAPTDMRHARHLYTLMIDAERTGITRDAFMLALHERGIGTGVHYRAVHLQPFYRRTFGYRPESFPNAGWISERTVSLPISPHLSDEDVDRVISAVHDVLT